MSSWRAVPPANCVRNIASEPFTPWSDAWRVMATDIPDVVICDSHLDKETSEAFLRSLGQRWPVIGRILYSGSAPNELVLDGLADLLLEKPADTQQLLSAVSELFCQRHTA